MKVCRFYKLFVVGFITLFLSGLNAAEGQADEHRANPNTCLFKRYNVAAAGGDASVFSFPSDDLGSDGPTRNFVAHVRGAASKSSVGVRSVPAEKMRSLCKKIAELDPTIISYSPDYEININIVPNDTYGPMGSLYGMNKISAPTAWDTTTGSSNIVVGVIDTGIDYNHPDLKDNMWVNPGEIPGNGIDDDANGYVDDVHGFDFHSNDGDPMDDNGHGTHCAGTIGGKGNNGVGVVGVNWNVKLMALKFLSGSGAGYLSNAIRAINYATANGADLTSNSWGGGGYSQAMYDAIRQARDADVLFVAAAGNSGQNADIFPMYPAAYNLTNIISVAATDSNDKIAYFSNYGSNTVDLTAPGVGIISTYKNGLYASLSGTSMAAPHVAGSAALLLSVYPDYSALQLKDALLNNTDYFSNLGNKVATAGRLNLYRSVLNGAVGGGTGGGFLFTLENAGDSGQAASGKFFPGENNVLRVDGTDHVDIKMSTGKMSCRLYSGPLPSGSYSKALYVSAKKLKFFKNFKFSASDGSTHKVIKAKISSSSLQSKKKKKKAKASSPAVKAKKFSKICKGAGGVMLN